MRTGQINAILFLLFTGFILISLSSHEPLDVPLCTSSPNSPVLNKAGRIGAYLSSYLFFFPFGLASWFIPAITLTWACNRLSSKKPEKSGIRISGTILVILTASCGFAFSNIDAGEWYFLPGGIVGAELSQLMLPWFGRWGSYLLVFFLFLAGAVLASEFAFLPWLRTLVIFAGRLAKKFAMLFSRRSQRTSPKIKIESGIQRTAPVIKREPERMETRKSAIVSEPYRKIAAAIPSGTVGVPPGKFELPPLDLLKLPSSPAGKEQDINEKCRLLEDALHSFGVESRVVQVNEGPIISSFEIEPARGVKVSQIASLSDDIALVLKATSVRIVTPVPGKSVVGIEIPNMHPRFVTLREVLESSGFRKSGSKLNLGLGKDILGNPLIADLSEMPHLLIAGTTGSGKTICLNSIILSIIFQATPEDVKFLMIDPKRVELAMFEPLPHLMAPVVTGTKKAAKALQWVVGEMDRRYQMLAEAGVRNITSYNRFREKDAGPEEKMPHAVVVIDELHDLMMVAQNSVEDAVTRLAQLSRAVGIHLVIATQRPSVDVITGVIKANLPYRISFQVSSKVDSRTVLDMNGAEKLMGKGDMLYLPPGRGTPVRAQGSLVSDEEAEKVVAFLRKQRPPAKSAIIPDDLKEIDGHAGKFETEFADDDELFEEAVRIVLQAGKASTSMLQRRLSIGYSRSARLLDRMEEKNIIGSSRGTKPRAVLTEDGNESQENE